MNAKIIQIVVMPGIAGTRPSLLALTEDGKIFKKSDCYADEANYWKEVPTEDFAKRRGNLI